MCIHIMIMIIIEIITWAVDKVDALHEGDVLPDLGLPRDGRHLADLLLLERVDDGALAHVGVADEANLRKKGRVSYIYVAIIC